MENMFINEKSNRGKKEYIFEGKYNLISISEVFNDIKIKPSEDDKTYLTVFENDEIKYEIVEDENLTINLKVQFKLKLKMPDNKYYVELKVPKTMLSEFKINDVSGYVKVHDLKAKKITINNVSGKIDVQNIGTREMELHNVSGRTTVDYVAVKKISIDSVSGSSNVRSIATEEMNMNTTSGKIKLALGKDQDNYNIKVNTLSGAIIVDEIKYKRNYDNKNGDKSIGINTLSGRVEIATV